MSIGTLAVQETFVRWPAFEALSEALTDRLALSGAALAAMMLVWASGVEASAGDGGGGGGAMMVAERSPTPVEERVRTGYLEDEAVCGFWTERLLSALYHLVAGRPDMERMQGTPGVERVSFITKDARRLGGYKLRAYPDANRQPRGYLLIAQGNAMLADQVAGEYRFFQADGLDVYVYDYRGYGISEGRSRFFAIRSDYIEIIEQLNRAGYASRFLYGMSLGGVFMLNAIGAEVDHDAALIDSPPSRISSYGCPPQYDPVANLPEDGARLGFIFGHRDTVVPPGAWRELSEAARARGAVVLEREEFAHPLMDRDLSARRARFELVRAFFARPHSVTRRQVRSSASSPARGAEHLNARRERDEGQGAGSGAAADHVPAIAENGGGQAMARRWQIGAAVQRSASRVVHLMLAEDVAGGQCLAARDVQAALPARRPSARCGAWACRGRASSGR